jgi:hypothetical protein
MGVSNKRAMRSCIVMSVRPATCEGVSVKNCVQCNKNLPDAALHCVFCGSKQPGHATAEVARTVMGYSASQVKEQLLAHNASAVAPAARPGEPLSPSHRGTPASPPGYAAATSYAPPPSPSQSPPPPSYSAPAQPGVAAATTASAATIFAPNPGGGGHVNAMAATVGVAGQGANPAAAFSPPPPSWAGPAGGYSAAAYQGSPPYVPPVAALLQPEPRSSSAPLYQSSQQQMPQIAQREGTPMDPYRDSLRLVLFAFGILLVGAFCTPVSNEPRFHWDVVLQGSTQAKISSLLLVVVGALSIVIASLPMSTVSRGVLSLAIAVLGVAAPMVLAKVDQWQPLARTVAPLLLVSGLLLRQEYRATLLPRLLVTGAILAVLPVFLVPVGGTVPVVGLLQQGMDAAGAAKVPPLLELGYVGVVALGLLVWLPAPSSAGAKLLAWLLIAWSAGMHVQRLILSENLADQLRQMPFGSSMSWAPAVAYTAIFGYGLASLLGKGQENA